MAAVKRKARKDFWCHACESPILCGSEYWVVTINGSGLGNTKRPDRVHDGECLKRILRGDLFVGGR